MRKETEPHSNGLTRIKSCYYFVDEKKSKEHHEVRKRRIKIRNRHIHDLFNETHSSELTDSELIKMFAHERLDSVKIIPENFIGKIQTLFIAGIHGNETKISPIMKKLFENSEIPHVEVLHAYPLAEYVNNRGYANPFREKIKDMNRKFRFSKAIKNWDKLLQFIKPLEAKFILRLIRDNPDLTTVFSFHEDLEFGDMDNLVNTNSDKEGFYFYHNVGKFSAEDNIVIDYLKQQMIKRLKKEGFVIFKGIDDPDDPNLNLSAREKGFIRTDSKINGSFENAMAALGKIGLTKITNVFTFEIPGKLTIERKTLMIEIVNGEFIIPFLKAQGKLK